MSRARRIALWAALPIGAVVVELGVRALGIAPLPLPEVQGDVLVRADYDDRILFENAPGRRKRIVYRDQPGEPRAVDMFTNALRFRGPVVRVHKPAEVFRVACLGDSHTFGDGVQEGQSWPAWLQTCARSDVAVQVLNCGVNGYDTVQQAVWFEHRVLPFEPDLVILAYFVNDVAARGVGAVESDALTRWTHPRRGGWIGELRRASRAFHLVCDAIYRHRARASFAADLWPRYRDEAPGWRRVEEGLVRLRDLCERAEIGLLIVPYPYVEVDAGEFRSRRAYRKVAGFCERERIPCFDPEHGILQRWSGEDLRVSPHDYHANGRAHRLFAATLAEHLAADGLPFASKPIDRR